VLFSLWMNSQGLSKNPRFIREIRGCFFSPTCFCGELPPPSVRSKLKCPLFIASEMSGFGFLGFLINP
jgi:hypothetical protein